MIRHNEQRWQLGVELENGERHTYHHTFYSESAIERMVAALNNEINWRELKDELGQKIVKYYPVKADFGPVNCF